MDKKSTKMEMEPVEMNEEHLEETMDEAGLPRDMDFKKFLGCGG